MITTDPNSADTPLEIIKSGLLDLTIHKAENLEKCDIFGKGDPYVVAILNGQKIHKTTVKHSTQQPSFNETKQSLLSDVTKSHLTLNVYDEDKFGADTFLGSVEFNLVRLRTSHLEFKALPLERSEKEAHGSLYISLSFNPMPIINPILVNPYK
ncbi:hypothetical protein ACHWQZ_G013800 [Mnemiopsis leidyi]